MFNFVRPHRRQPTRLPRPWDSPGKNTGVGCHFLLQCRKVESESEVAQSCPTLSDPMDCSPLGSSIHGIFQARALEWGATAFFNWMADLRQITHSSGNQMPFWELSFAKAVIDSGSQNGFLWRLNMTLMPTAQCLVLMENLRKVAALLLLFLS